MTITLTEEDLLVASYSAWSTEQAILGILKEKGGPIEGNFFLHLNRKYSVKKHRDHLTGNIIYEFIERKQREKCST